MGKEFEYVIPHCSKCDICINSAMIPSRGGGITGGVLFIIDSPTKTEHKKNTLQRHNKIIQNLCDEYNFDYYITYLVKCISKRSVNQFEIDNCKHYIIDEIFKVNPQIIVTVGDIVTRQFLEFHRFKQVVDKPITYNINKKDIVLYPIHSPKYKVKEGNAVEYYENIFSILAKFYKLLVNPKYIHYDLFKRKL